MVIEFPAEETPPGPSADAARRVVVVGAGLAGYTVARTLRAEGFAGEIVVLGAEAHRPYDRPPLSKQFLSGALGREELALGCEEDGDGVQWLLGSAAVGLDAATRTVQLADGRSVTGDEIVLATGVKPRTIPGLDGTARGVHTLSTIEDAEALRDELAQGRRVVVAGGGFVALEVAATAAHLNTQVTVVCGDDEPLASRFGSSVSGAVRALHEAHGVAFVTGARVAEVRHDGAATRGVRLTDGRELPADVVVAGIGAAPEVGWLEGSGLLIGPGVVCDADGRAAEGVWAVGDCADWAGVACGHWTLASQRAQHVARLLAGTEPSRAELPYLWSDQFGSRLQLAGAPRCDDEVVIETGSLEGGDVFLTYHRDGEQVGAFGMNQPRLMMRWRKTHRPAPAAATAAA